MTYIEPSLDAKAFTCPHCAIVSQQYRFMFIMASDVPKASIQSPNDFLRMDELSATLCAHCEKWTIFSERDRVFPQVMSGPPPSDDMPQDVRDEYEEARKVYAVSPKASAALLRLSVERLCRHLVGSEDVKNDVNGNIKLLVQKGLEGVMNSSPVIDVV